MKEILDQMEEHIAVIRNFQRNFDDHSIHSVINRNRARHSRESGNPEKHWIPGQARNDELHKIYVVMYKRLEKLMKSLNDRHLENMRDEGTETAQSHGNSQT